METKIVNINYAPCGAPLILRTIVRCTCTRPKDHKGRHSASFKDGSDLKWSNKKRNEVKYDPK